MKYWAITLLAGAWALSSCVWLPPPKTLPGIKEGLNCIPYEKGMPWQQIAETLKAPDIYPLPEPGTGLGRNARVFTRPLLILYVENEEFQEGEKTRFREVARGLEICAEKK